MTTQELSYRKIFLTEKLKNKLSLIYKYPVTVVSAPLGYGKTMSVKEFLKDNTNSNVQVFWSTAFNDDVSGFYIDFCNAFSEIDSVFSDTLKTLGFPQNHSDERRLIERIIQRFPLKTMAVIVIDQMELTSDLTIQNFLLFLIRHLPSNIHLVLIGRSYGICSYDIFKFVGMVNFVRSEDFELSVSDIEIFSRLYHINLPTGAAAKLYSITGGWMCLVHMNLMEYKTNSGFYQQEEMISIIEKVIINPMTDSQKEFLESLALCDEFTKEQAVFLSCSPDASKLFDIFYYDEAYIRQNRKTNKYFFIPPIQQYQKHHYKYCDEARKNELVNVLANWYLTIEDNAMARRLFHSIGNFDALMEAVEKRKFLVTYGLDEQEFISYYTECPAQIRAKHPKAIITFARQMFLIGSTEMGYDACYEFEKVMKEHTQNKIKDDQQLLVPYEMLLSYAHYNDLPRMTEHILKIREIKSSNSNFPIWTEANFGETYSLLFMYHREAGELSNEIKQFSEYARIYASVIGDYLCGAEDVIRAEYAFLRNHVNEAKIYISKAIFQINRDSQWNIWLCAMLLDIRIALYSGEWDLVERKIEEIESAVAYRNKPQTVSAHQLFRLYINGILSVKTELAPHVNEFFTSRKICGFQSASMLYCIYASTLLTAKNSVTLLALSDTFLDSARKYPNLLAEIVIEIEIASAYETLNDRKNAELHLLNALKAAEPDDIQIVFIEYYRYIRSILIRIKDTSTFVQQLISQGSLYLEHIGSIPGVVLSQGNYGLTNREIEIAMLAAKRLSNKEIADSLNIAESTVKTQLSHAFSKLNIQKRYDLTLFFSG